MMKILLKRILIGVTIYFVYAVIMLLFDPDLRFHFIVVQNTRFEIFLFIVLIFFLLSIWLKNKNLKFIFESALLFFIAYMFFITVIFFTDNMNNSLSWSIIFTSILIFSAWVLQRKLSVKKSNILRLTLIIVSSIILIDLLNMIWFISSLNIIDKIQYTEEVKNIDLNNSHYSIYSELDTFNITQSEIPTIGIPLLQSIKDSLKNYDECQVRFTLNFSPYLRIIKRDMISYNWLEKFYTEYLITLHNEGYYYLDKKTGFLIEQSDFFKLKGQSLNK